MKKIKIILGAIALFSLLAINSFALETKEAIVGSKPRIVKKMEKTLNEIKEFQAQKALLLKMNTKAILLGEEFSSSSSSENFKILLPKSLKDAKFPMSLGWQSKEASFVIEINFPYAYVTVIQNLAPFNTVKMTLSSTEHESFALVFIHGVNGKKMQKFIGSRNPYSSSPSAPLVKETIGKTFKVQDTANKRLTLSEKKYFSTGGFWEGQKYFYFKLNNIDTETGEFSMSFTNDNPLIKEVSVKIVENTEEGKVYCYYTIEGQTYEEVIAVKMK